MGNLTSRVDRYQPRAPPTIGSARNRVPVRCDFGRQQLESDAAILPAFWQNEGETLIPRFNSTAVGYWSFDKVMTTELSTGPSTHGTGRREILNCLYTVSSSLHSPFFNPIIISQKSRDGTDLYKKNPK